MVIRLYFDEDSQDSDVVLAVRSRGVDALTANEAGMQHRLDEEHLDFATAQGRVLYSFNVGDFSNLHIEYIVSNKSHAGIIIGQQQRYSVGEQMRRLMRIVNARTAEQMVDQLEFLSNWG
jgi:hypothetical protein